MSCTISSPASAKALVESICKDNGYMDEVSLGKLSHDNRQTVEALLTDRAAAGNAATALASKLDEGDGRFVESLLRNADDNHFTKARSLKEDPTVTFKIAPSHITVECNEDGFTPEHLRAICAIGKSTKTDISPQCFRGEGIGFKSIFMVAYKVHIESGHFSFSFNHRRGQRGMGMISPTWEAFGTSPPAGVTRMRLFLDPKLTHASKISIMRQFKEVETALLLYLRNIRCITIVHETDEGATKSSERYSITQETVHLIKLTKQQDGVANEVNHYHVTRHVAPQVPRNENRVYPELSVPLPRLLPSEVVLAFPLDKARSNPVVSSQQVFAFTSIGNKGFKFLIQADFTTQNNRQDVNATSIRNMTLLDSIATAFSVAMQQLCDNDALRYKWMRYLPQKDDHRWDGYWKMLYDMIKMKIEATALMRYSGGLFAYTTRDTRRLPRLAVDSIGDSIFGGNMSILNLSTRYEERDLNSLNDYGLKTMTYLEVLGKASFDIARQNSRMKHPTTSDQWHTDAANCLSLPFEEKWEEGSALVRNMDLIPLVDGGWVSAASVTKPLSFANIFGFEIPRGLPLTLISSSASKNPARAALFQYLGARNRSIAYIRELIFSEYPVATQSNSLMSESISEATSLEHLKFLYLTRNYRQESSEGYERIAVFTDGNVWRKPLSQDVYMSSNHRYSASNLLKPATAQPRESQDNITGLDVHFLSSSYASGAQWQEEDAWADWLQATLNIRVFLPLVYDDELTVFFRFISENRSDQLVEILQFFWPRVSRAASQCQAVRKEIAHCLVPTACGPTKLMDATLPYPDLIQTVSLFVGNTTSFPFLKLSHTLAPEEQSSWSFLSDNFGVVGSKNFEFYLDILVCISEADHDGAYGQRVPEKAFEVYSLIHKELDAEVDREYGCERVRDYFEKCHPPLILLPIEGNGSDRWMKIDHCRWDCPPNMKSLYGIRSHYSPLFQGSGQMDTIMAFMKEVVGVLNLSQEDVVNELRLQKEGTDPDEHLIREMYLWLAGSSAVLSKSDENALRRTFRDNALIFAAGKWCTTLDCIWSCKSDISDKIDLSHHYPDMETMFVTMMGVPTDTLESVYDELQTMGASHSTTVDEIKRQFWQLNSLLSTAKSKPDPRPILESPVFPVRSPDGCVRLLSADESDFVIIDRRLDEKRFHSIAKVLDFSLNEVHRLRPFLEWAGLNNRLLSVKVTETVLEVEKGESTRESQRDIKSKAYSLCRIATHFGSPRARDPRLLYQLLENFKVFESPLIKVQWRLTQDGRTWGVDDSEAMIYYDDSEPDVVSIYVPTDVSRREICFLYYLPLILLDWMMDGSSLAAASESRVAIPLIMSVLNTDPSSAELLLDREGIVQLEFPADSERRIQVVGPAEGTAAQHSGKETPSTARSTSKDSSIKSVIQGSRDDSGSEGRRPLTAGTVVSDGDTIGTETLVSSAISTPTKAVQSQNSNGRLSASPNHRTPEATACCQPSTPNLPSSQTLHSSHSQLVASQDASTPSRSSTPDTRGYVALLDKIIKITRVATFPQKGFDMSALKQSLPKIDSDKDTDDYLKGFIWYERLRRMGAAGELYVFELLSTLSPQLPNFSREAWKSSIRHKVSDHSAYHDLQAQKKETADIVYADAAGVLTAMLIEHGYLDEERWRGRKPTHYIEVKTTTGPCERPFFLSWHQCTTMHEISRTSKDSEGQEAIYTIFRVFNLGKEDMSLRLYVDPAALEQQGALLFKADKRSEDGWSVVPGSDLRW